MPLIVGDLTDPHVAAVVDELTSPATVLDAASLLHSPITLLDDQVIVGGVPLAIGTGWLRRLAPEGWAEAMSKPGVDAAARAAAMSALAAIARDERIRWLTPIEHLGAAENKPYQYRRARELGVPIPEWIVSTDPSAIPTSGQWVSKPLGPGSFIDGDGKGWIVPTAQVDVTGDRDVIARVPFILQRMIRATRHARVITVGSSVFSATLHADALPLDWRLSEAGHYGFEPTPVPEEVHSHAAAAARACGVGYSAQDWIRDELGRWWFVDLNPAGQWLFLPDDVSQAVTAAIANFLNPEHAGVVP